jgi:hypothetical protein
MSDNEMKEAKVYTTSSEINNDLIFPINDIEIVFRGKVRLWCNKQNDIS